MKKKFRDPASGLIHLISALLALVGFFLLIRASKGDNFKQISVVIYSFSLVQLFTASSIYHLANPREKFVKVLRKIDHSAIYILIAGTYTPICLNILQGSLRWWFLAVIWGMALIGVGVKVFIINVPRWVTAGVYLLMGWMALIIIKPLLLFMPAGGLFWLLAGGLLFTIGAIIYVTKKMDLVPGIFGFHEVWHVFVSLGCFCHFIMIYKYIALV